jgi:hypothetical protein
MTTMKKHWLRRAPKFVAVAIVIVAIVSAIVMLLWNWLMPGLFGLPSITYWQALGLLLLCKLLFGRFHGRGEHHHWRERMIEKWAHMTPEERERFLQGAQKMGPACGPSAPPNA